jgi:hypothetical protein
VSSERPDGLFERVRAAAAAFPGVEVGSSYGTPALRVRKRLLARMWEDGETLVFPCSSIDEKEFLMETEPEVYYETDHYRGHPHVLIRLAMVTDERLREHMEDGWQRFASKKMVVEWEANQ